MFEFFIEESQRRINTINPILFDGESQESLEGDVQETCDSFKIPKKMLNLGLSMTQRINTKRGTDISPLTPLSRTIKNILFKKIEDTIKIEANLKEKFFSSTCLHSPVTTLKPSSKKLNPKEI